MGTSQQTLSLDDRRAAAAWAADCAEHVLHHVEDALPGDDRVRTTIAQARAFATGDLPVDGAIRLRGGDAGAAARAVSDRAATAAAYAAEQAAAVAHMGAHALGAAGYAAKAAALAASDEHAALLEEVQWQVDALPPVVAGALRTLPLLGEDRAGPLGPGRLRSGHVGTAITAIQAALHER